MFTFECLNHRAKLILDSWEAVGFGLRDFYIEEKDGYTHIHCKYDSLHYKKEEVNTLISRVSYLNKETREPYFIANSIGHVRGHCYHSNGAYTYWRGDVLTPFNWPQQIERYRVALLLKATE